ncbi:MAG: hypothetical protein CFE32_05670 [Alphaproteobacteria bacterium PA3]|nr:MAG: hypothetical protein CFE32_05670 [Alphaproteobacteria bacterium PA3]
MSSHFAVFSFSIGAHATYRDRCVVIEKKLLHGYALNYLPHPGARDIPAPLRGTRPDIEFCGQKFHTHEELSNSLLKGELVLHEESYSFVDDTQRFRTDIVARLDDRRKAWAIMRYASVCAYREMRKDYGRSYGLVPYIIENEKRFLDRVEGLCRQYLADVNKLGKRRYPFEKVEALKHAVTPRKVKEWDEDLKQRGFAAMIDQLPFSGNRSSRFHIETVKIIEAELDKQNTAEKLNVARLHDSVRGKVRKLAAVWPDLIAERLAQGEVLPPSVQKVPVPPSYQALREIVKKIAPLRLLLAQHGEDWMLRNRISKGMGLEVTRAGQVVICDEYETDLFTLVSTMQIVDWIGPEEMARLGLGADLNPVRCVISVVIDAYSCCILALKISLRASHDMTKTSIMMMMQDKRKLSTAAGCQSVWHHSLRPEIFLTDGGNFYVSLEAEKYCGWNGIDKQVAPSGLANLRGMLERFFRTMHVSILARFPGRSFSTVVERGEYDAQASAVLTLDQFVQILTVWIVDCYHNTQHDGLGPNLTPNDVWNHEMKLGMGVRPVPSPSHMTKVFGTPLSRIAQDTGIRVLNLRYDSEDFVRFRARNPKRQFHVMWWEENLDRVCVEIGPDTWMDLEVMDAPVKGMCVDEWCVIWEQREIAKVAGREEAFNLGLEQIEHLREHAIAMRQKVSRPSLDEASVNKIEAQMVRHTKFPSKAITPEQSHGLYGAPIGGAAVAPAQPVTLPAPSKVGSGSRANAAETNITNRRNAAPYGQYGEME